MFDKIRKFFSTIKKVYAVLQKISSVDFDAYEKINRLQQENEKVKTENNILKKNLEIKESIFLENNAYWIKKGDKKDGAFCTCCWDDSRKLIRLSAYGKEAYAECPKCKYTYQIGADSFNREFRTEY